MNRPKIVKYLLFGVLWAAVAAYVGWSAGAARRHRREQRIERLTVEIADSSSHGYLVTGDMVRKWIAENDIPTVGETLEAVRLHDLEGVIRRNGFVERVDAYVTYGGELRIVIRQRKPVLRLRVDGYDAYVTAEGYLFAAPRRTSLYVPVASGSYRPPVAADYTGLLDDALRQSRAESEKRLAAMEREKYPLYEQEQEALREYREVRRKSAGKRWFEDEERHRARAEALKQEKKEARRRYRYRTQMIARDVAAVEARQESERRAQKKLEKNFADFSKLITFVKFVEKDDFWRSEIVQIVASASPSGALELELIPRSGRHTIRFGQIVDVERKFDKLLRFYRNGLGRIGWEEYRRIDVAYDGQVVCTK